MTKPAISIDEEAFRDAPAPTYDPDGACTTCGSTVRYGGRRNHDSWHRVVYAKLVAYDQALISLGISPAPMED